MISKGGAVMYFVIVSCENFRFYLCCKVFDRALPSGIAYYKNKRPPPVPGESLNGAVAIRFTHINNPFYFLRR